jgi:hypothetical protein
MNAIGKAAAIVAIYIAVGPIVIAITIGVFFAGIAAIGGAVESNDWLRALTSLVLVAPMLGASSLPQAFVQGAPIAAGVGLVVAAWWAWSGRISWLMSAAASFLAIFLPGLWPNLFNSAGSSQWAAGPALILTIHLVPAFICVWVARLMLGPSEASAPKPPPEMKL